jgi:hypothetical protein
MGDKHTTTAAVSAVKAPACLTSKRGGIGGVHAGRNWLVHCPPAHARVTLFIRGGAGWGWGRGFKRA